MWGCTCLPSTVYPVRYPRKRHFRCAQARHFLVCCWWRIALIRAPGNGTLQGLQAYLPPTLNYWTTWRMLRSSHWEAEAVVDDRATATLRALPPPTAGVLDRMGESTLKDQRGRQHPWGPTTRHREPAP
jgi:hypothetical protein